MDERVGQVRKMMSNDEIGNNSRFLEGHCKDEYGNIARGKDDNEDDNALQVIGKNRWKCAPQLHIIGTGMF